MITIMAEADDAPRGDDLSPDSLTQLRREFKDLSSNAQQLLTEKLYLENECSRLKKRVNSLDEEIRSDGHSLLPIMDQKETEEKPIFIRSSFPMNQKSGYLLGIRTSKYKYMRSSDDPKKHVFLFDLEKDPKEEKNIATEKLDTVNEYEDFLKNYFFQTKNEEEFDKSQTKIIEDELKRLGYIN